MLSSSIRPRITPTRPWLVSLRGVADLAIGHPLEYASTATPCLNDPLQIYQGYVNRGILQPDVKQLQAAVQFQKLCFRLQDYEPDYTELRINQLVRELEAKYNRQERRRCQIEEYKGAPARWWTFFGDIYGRYRESKDTAIRKEIIRVMSDEELLENFPAPQGLLVNGEVGTGKSMLLDIFADCAPCKRKMRIHYHEFILWVMREIDGITRRRLSQKTRDDWANQENHPLLNMENEFILYEVATRLIRKSYLLMLDEFMLPDIAAAKIVKVLLTYYFKLGGVLVATSNKLPDELYSNDFNRTQFEGFSRVLKLRCEVYDIDSANDYRVQSMDTNEPYVVINDDGAWNKLVDSLIETKSAKPDHFENFGRTLDIPLHHGGAIMAHFEDLCKGETFGAGDFIELANKYHTVIIDQIPALTTQEKDQAHRFITLIDALYEARCTVAMQLEVEPDKLFFHKTSGKNKFKCTPLEDNRIDVQNEEMAAKTEMDLANPYRPNFASYEEGERKFATPTKARLHSHSAFTGEDEMFAYKRAVSRIKEMGYSERWRAMSRK